MRIEEYFRQVDATLTLCSRVALKTMLYDERSDTKGFIRGLLHFDDGSELHIREFVDVSTGIERYKYSYHYMRAGRLVCRYDSSADIAAVVGRSADRGLFCLSRAVSWQCKNRRLARIHAPCPDAGTLSSQNLPCWCWSLLPRC